MTCRSRPRERRHPELGADVSTRSLRPGSSRPAAVLRVATDDAETCEHDTVESAPPTRRGRALAETSSQPPCVGEASGRSDSALRRCPSASDRIKPVSVSTLEPPHRRHRQRVDTPAQPRFVAATEPLHQLIWSPGPKRTSARSGGRRRRTRVLPSETQCRKSRCPADRRAHAMSPSQGSMRSANDQRPRRPRMGRIPSPETKPPEPTRHPDCRPRWTQNGVSTAPKQPPQREHARRGRLTQRLRGRAETQPQRHRDSRPGPGALTPELPRTPSPRRQRARQDDDEPEGPPVEVTHQRSEL